MRPKSLTQKEQERQEMMQFHKTMLRMETLAGAAVMLSALALTVPAQAQSGNLVKDGGFETAIGGVHSADDGTASLGDGWTMTQGSTFVFNGVVDPGFPHSGNQGLDLTLNGTATNSISQLLDTTPGQDYTLSFYASNNAPGSLFSVQFGDSLYDLTVPANGIGQPNYTFFSLDVAATGKQTALAFTGNNLYGDSYGIQLDDVKVASVAAPVPEASTTVSLGLLLALGLSSIAVTMRRKKSCTS